MRWRKKVVVADTARNEYEIESIIHSMYIVHTISQVHPKSQAKHTHTN